MVVGACGALAWHFKQRYDMRHFADKVSTRLEKQGGAAVLNEDDSSVTIYMDGKVQEVI